MDKKKYILMAMALGNVLLAGDIIKEIVLWLYGVEWKDLPLFVAVGGLSETLTCILLIAGAVGLLKRDKLWGYWGACAAALLHSFHYLVVLPFFWGNNVSIPGTWLFQVPWIMFLYIYPVLFLIVINTNWIRTVFISRNRKPVLIIFITSLVLVDYIAILYPQVVVWLAIVFGFLLVLYSYGPSEITVPWCGPTKRKARLQAEQKTERVKSVVGISVFLAVFLILAGLYLKEKVGPYRMEIREDIKKEKLERRESTLYNEVKPFSISALSFPGGARERLAKAVQ